MTMGYQIRAKRPYEQASLEQYAQRENVGLVNYAGEFYARAVADALKKHGRISCIVTLDGKEI